ncbi:hypothetical protein EMIHUDRAFT_228194 [Emiliania huxleyi CCMP1516]|uniref:Ankyrin repeat protein n=4 Tax=Emiliania huxleyi TaxID=2903 RepID=A0A0D3KGK6_EMIH1|nr:hypothetical protein EMIHUDRAFT_228194 [Emiliania huxleyi CCMP1516]EOD34891.1 hypothetical protein EMIHUDRAFT_228194 [Emiliania huxleyi CCMP1516]|eukprot:XP_005787320.1 hypothetical protein EMIHUDRAFT_228194 [Emiliania huxleyi CCMP1516]
MAASPQTKSNFPSDANDNRTPTAANLCTAAYRCDLPLLMTLLEAGADPNAYAKCSAVNGYTALTAACGFAKDSTVVRAMIDHLLNCGASIDHPNHYGRTPLMSAVINSNAATCDILLQRGALLDLRHKNGMTAVAYGLKAVNESRSDEERVSSRAVARTLLYWRARRRWQKCARYVRIHLLVAQRWRRMLLALFRDVHYRPGGLGEATCRARFKENCALLRESSCSGLA